MMINIKLNSINKYNHYSLCVWFFNNKLIVITKTKFVVVFVFICFFPLTTVWQFNWMNEWMVKDFCFFLSSSLLCFIFFLAFFRLTINENVDDTNESYIDSWIYHHHHHQMITCIHGWWPFFKLKGITLFSVVCRIQLANLLMQ